MAIHARIFYYTQRIGVSIDFAAYQAWLASHPDHRAPDILPPEYKSSTGAGQPTETLDWQQAAPKADLYVERGAADASSSSGGEPAYPMAFAEMIKLLQEGKPVPGIKQIPNTVIRDPVCYYTIYPRLLQKWLTNIHMSRLSSPWDLVQLRKSHGKETRLLPLPLSRLIPWILNFHPSTLLRRKHKLPKARLHNLLQLCPSPLVARICASFLSIISSRRFGYPDPLALGTMHTSTVSAT